MAVVRQRALTVVAPLREGWDQDALCAALIALKPALSGVKTLHFARFVVLPPDVDATNGARIPPKLVCDTIFDGARGAHLTELERVMGEAALARALSACEGYRAGMPLAEFARAHHVPSLAFYLGHGGLAAQQIRNDAAVRRAADAWLDDEHRKRALASRSPGEIHDALLTHLRGVGTADEPLVLGPVPRGLPGKVAGTLRAGVSLVPVLARALVLLARARSHERADDLQANHSPPRFDSDTHPRCTRIAEQESAAGHNALTHLVSIKPSRFRRDAVRTALRVVSLFARWTAVHGQLGGLSTIHFARWCMLPDGRLLFLSNYDGSWEAYLGDFIDKASPWLTGIWSNAKWFPSTRYLAFDGARDEETFKRWTRHFQCPFEVWHSAYPELSVDNVLANARLREMLPDRQRSAEIMRLL